MGYHVRVDDESKKAGNCCRPDEGWIHLAENLTVTAFKFLIVMLAETIFTLR
jgi:hypothetical protein